MENFNIGALVIYMVVLLFAISAHEAAHAWMSYKFGDDTARLLGRITLNPAKHTDPIGTLLIPIVNFIFAQTGGGGFMLIGWGKPTPVNPLRWRNKDVANVMVSLAGIMANLTIAICALVLVKVVQYTGLIGDGGALASVAEPVWVFLINMLVMNVSLAFFNLLPFPPLDGSKVLYTFLPASMQPTLEALERYGFILLLIVVNMGVTSVLFRPIARLLVYLIRL
ncbi:MAG TPA: site-2 protease family protein [Pyrinomonadaceae bacterium]|jgi:Zn-dependent protease